MSSDVLVAGETIARAIAEGLSTIARAQEEGPAMTKRFIRWSKVLGTCPICGCQGTMTSNANRTRERTCWAWQCRTKFTLPGRFKGRIWLT